jgi:hypothetical protein
MFSYLLIYNLFFTHSLSHSFHNSLFFFRHFAWFLNNSLFYVLLTLFYLLNLFQLFVI